MSSKTLRVFADLVKLGEQPAPWYRSELEVYVAFQFTSASPQNPLPIAADQDVRQKISPYRKLGGCLRASLFIEGSRNK